MSRFSKKLAVAALTGALAFTGVTLTTGASPAQAGPFWCC